MTVAKARWRFCHSITAPGDTHPNCQCWAEPLTDPEEPKLDPIEPVYPIEYLIGLLTGTGVAMKIGREIIKEYLEMKLIPKKLIKLPMVMHMKNIKASFQK